MHIGAVVSLTLATIVMMSPVASVGQPSADETIQYDVIIAVAQALGADAAKLPSYDSELKMARRSADFAAVCGGNSKGQFLTPAVAEKVVAHALASLKQKSPSLWERPRYIRDLIIVSAASFEAGRLAATTKEYLAELTANAPPGTVCTLKGQ